MEKLSAFNGDAAIKAAVVSQLQAHYEADEIRHGYYWENGKGCAVGCTVHSSDHSLYASLFQIPRILARLEDQIFEGMTNGDAKEFPLQFINAIKPGADLSLVWPKFAVWLLVDKKEGVVRHAKKDSAQYVVIHRVAELYQQTIDGMDVPKSDWQKARSAAAAYAADVAYAAAAADAAAAYAADAAYAHAAAAAAYAAYSAAAVAYAADAAYAAATATADAAYAAAYADAAYAAAQSQSFKRQADKLIQLLSEAA